MAVKTGIPSFSQEETKPKSQKEDSGVRSTAWTLHVNDNSKKHSTEDAEDYRLLNVAADAEGLSAKGFLTMVMHAVVRHDNLRAMIVGLHNMEAVDSYRNMTDEDFQRIADANDAELEDVQAWYERSVQPTINEADASIDAAVSATTEFAELLKV